MNFQEAHKKLFQGPFGKPKHVPQLLLKLDQLRYKDFFHFNEEISIIATKILDLLANRDFNNFDYWERTDNGKPKLPFFGGKEYLKKLFTQVQLTNEKNSNVFEWPKIEGWLHHSIELQMNSGRRREKNFENNRLVSIIHKIDSKLKSKFENSSPNNELTIIISIIDKGLKSKSDVILNREEFIKFRAQEIKTKHGETLAKIDNIGVKRNGGQFMTTMVIKGTIEQLIKVIELEDVEYAFDDSILHLI